LANLDRYTEQLERVLATGTMLINIGDVDILLEQVLTEARYFAEADAGSIYTLEGDELAFRHAQNDTLASRGVRIPYTRFTMPKNRGSIAGFVACTGEMLNIPNVRDIPSDEPYSFDDSYDRRSDYTTLSSLTLPLINTRHRVMGVLQLINAKGTGGRFTCFNPSVEPLAKYFASLATIALERAMMTRTLLMRMINMTELRDPKETGPHVNRVGSYSVAIYDSWASVNGYGEREKMHTRDILRMAAMLHDVGKTGIGDDILKKPEPLSEQEREVMQSHCKIGVDILRTSESEFDEMAMDIASCHHENWDGTGYPRGISGTSIPFMARIVSIADVYDALSSKRAYKEPWPEEKVNLEMDALFGTKFDPGLKKHFFNQLAVMREIRQSYPED
jgi:HD-GYP domain-containing protein (c-di-GMP phosphodiesterase class II)